MTEGASGGLPETWHAADKKTLDEVARWIRTGHPDLCSRRLEEVIELGDLRYETARAMFLAHAIQEHGAGLEVLMHAFDRKPIYGHRVSFLTEVIREHARDFVDEVLRSWGKMSHSREGRHALATILGALSGEAPPREPPPSINQLAIRTAASFAWVHEIVNELADRGWLAKTDRVEIVDPRAVFEWWISSRTEPKGHRFHVADPLDVAGRLLHDFGVDHAITTYYAENAFQGHLFPRRFDAYVREEDLPRARAGVVELGGSLGGTNFRLLTGDDSILDEAILGQDGSELLYAPLPQIILDLMSEGGSAREAADLLIQRAYPHANPTI